MPVGYVEKNTVALRSRRRRRIRKRIWGTAQRPRLSVFRSNKHIYAQIVDDDLGHTLVQASSRHLGIKGSCKTVDVAKQVGKTLAESAKKAGVEEVAFDRGGYLYHGRVQALAEGAREGGLRF
jgi:large subunit ribosomal protein L18